MIRLPPGLHLAGAGHAPTDGAIVEGKGQKARRPGGQQVREPAGFAGKKCEENAEHPPVKRSTYAQSKAKRWAIRRVFERGFLEIPAGPWCIGATVMISAHNVKDTDRAGMTGRIIWPSDRILKEWVQWSSCEHGPVDCSCCVEKRCWDHRWARTPNLTVCVLWDDGQESIHTSDYYNDPVCLDLQIIVPPPSWPLPLQSFRRLLVCMGTCASEELGACSSMATSKSMLALLRVLWQRRSARFSQLCLEKFIEQTDDCECHMHAHIIEQEFRKFDQHHQAAWVVSFHQFLRQEKLWQLMFF